MELSQFEIKKATYGDLRAMISICEQELKMRDATRRDELVQAVCDAMNTLHKEFPTVELRMNFQCPECALDDDFDVMEYFCGDKQMNRKDFYIY